MPLRETPGTSAQACARPSQSASAIAGVLAAACAARRRARRPAPGRPRRPAARPAASRPCPGAARSAARSARPASAGGTNEPREPRSEPVAAQPAERLGDLVAQRDEQRGRRPGVQRDLERLAQLAVELGVGPAEQQRHGADVRRGRDRQQLGRARGAAPRATAWWSGSALGARRIGRGRRLAGAAPRRARRTTR